MTQIIKTKFLCRNGSRTAPRGSFFSNIKWTDRFIEGKWYEGEYETWSFEDGFRLNGGWRRYWVINEQGIKEEIPKAHMKAIFEFEIDKLREEKLNKILNDGEKD